MSSLWTAFAPGAWTALPPMGRRSSVDTTDFAALDVPGLVQRLTRCAEEILQAQRSPEK